MRATMMYAPGDVRVEERPEPTIENPTDAVISLSASCICGSDLWPYRGADPVDGPIPMGHEYVGIVEEVGAAVAMIRPGQFVVGSFFASDNTCEICRAGYQTSCVNREILGTAGGAQAQRMRVPLAVVVVGDGAVGLCAVLAASQLGAERIVAMSRHETRQRLAREFGATDIIAERGDAGVKRIKELTNGLGAHSVIEAVGTQESMLQAIQSTRPGGHVGYVGVTHDVTLDGEELFMSHVHLHGGPAPVRRFLPDLMDRIWNRTINPGKVFDLELPLDDAAAGYRAMDTRQATKVLLRP